jgi:uncharacterized membrane protein YdjX (TVP38/TMEM64 family)
MDSKKQNKKKLIIKLIVSALILVLFLGLMYLIFYRLGITELTQEEIQSYLESKGALAPLLFILITFLQVTFIPIPSTITVLVGNYLFGFWASYLYSFIGMMLGSMFAFYLGRWFGKKFIYWLVNDKEMVDSYLNKIKNKGNVLLFFMFIFPFFPDDILCFVAGITAMSPAFFIVMIFITRIISVFTSCYSMNNSLIPYDTWWGILLWAIFFIVTFFLTYMLYKKGDKISLYFKNKLKSKKKSNDLD